MKGTDSKADLGAVGLAAIVAIVVGLTSWAGIIMIHSGSQTAFWPANGVLLAFLLTAPPKRWAACLAAGFFASMAIHLYFGYGGSLSVGLSVANTIEIYIAAWPFRKTAPQRPELTQAGSVLRFTVFAGLLGPMASGVWLISTTPQFLTGFSLLVKFRLWFVADSLGMVLCAPLMLALLDRELLKAFSGKRLAETAGLLAAVTLVAFFVFRDNQFPFPFLVLVALIPVIFRLGLSASAVGVLLISFPAAYYTFAGRGPLARAGMIYWSLYLQVYFIVLLATVYVLSTVRAEEKRLADKLRSSETRYRVLAETSQDLILRTTLDGFRTYVSPSVRGVTGWTEEELPPPANFSVLVHPADRPHFAGFLDKLRAQPGSHTLVYRAKRRDGQYGWLEAYVGTVFNESAVPNELVWTIRDISLRIEHEETLKSERQKAQELAWTDGLTGLSNRRAFDERLAAEWIFASQHQAPLSLLLLDVDHFKAYNDTYGHQTGDEALRRIALTIGECARQSGDLAARYGGEEFAVVLPRADTLRAREVAERIRARVQDLALEHSRSENGIVTLSIGVSSAGRVGGTDPETLLAAADGALYAAKRGGRNRISVAASALRSYCPGDAAQAPESVPADAPHRA
jgi:diguanylate cyclase (GGDEF)-like protein/PAS domain S-box-containing protein